MKYNSEEEFLAAYNAKDYDQLSLTTDILVFSVSTEEQDNYRKSHKKYMSILMVKREDYPYKDKWCLPGGFIGIDEDLEECPIRILERETGLKNIYLEQLYTFGGVNRDPRTRVISTSYMSLIDKSMISDELCKNASWFNVSYEEVDDMVYLILDNGEEIIKYNIKKEFVNNKWKYHVLNNSEIAFDHAMVIWMGIDRLKNKCEYTDIVFNMMPRLFTLGDLQRVYEVILNKKLLDPAFRRIIGNKVRKTEFVKSDGGHRPSTLFEYKGNNEI